MSTIQLSKPQWEVATSQRRFNILIAGRRFGKTYALLSRLLSKANKPNSVNWYVAPTYKQAKLITWKPLKNILPKSLIRHKNESELSIELINGSVIRLMGAENYDNLRGPGLDHVQFDEFADIDPDAWTEVIRPMLADRQGSADFGGTPKGFNWAYDLYLKAQNLGNWGTWQFTTLDGGNVTQAELDLAAESMDARTFKQEFLASFEALGNRVYDQFDRAENVRQVQDRPSDPLLVGMDFNILPMSAVLAVRVGDQCHVIDNIELQISNTEEMAQEIRRRYPHRAIVVCPDPSGKARKTSAPVGQTDFTILQQYSFYIQAPNAAPLVVDRINNTQAMFCSASGNRRLLIHPRCEPLIKCLEGLTYVNGKPDKKSGLDHLPDALGYLLWSQFNLLDQAGWSLGSVRGGGY